MILGYPSIDRTFPEVLRKEARIDIWNIAEYKRNRE
jgi:hypothetical protein